MNFTETEGGKAYEISERIKNNELGRRSLMISNIVLLAELYNSGLYKAVLGDENAPWSAFLGQIEVFYSRAQVNTLLRIYKKFTLELSMNPDTYFDVPWSRLEMLIPVINENNRQEWVDKARALLRKDFDIELRKSKGLLTEEDDHVHDMTDYKICGKCGLKVKSENFGNEEE